MYDQLIYDTAISEGFNPTVAKLIVAQARLESSNYGSNVFKCNNNMYGMKYVGQPLATKGTLAPSNEISSGCSASGSGCQRTGVGNCRNGDFYAKYSSPADSVRDVIQRLYKTTRKGIGFNELNSATDSLSFATMLKQRDYYGFKPYGTSGAEEEIKYYSGGLKARLRLINIIEWYNSNKKPINLAVIGIILIGITGYVYFLRKKLKN